MLLISLNLFTKTAVGVFLILLLCKRQKRHKYCLCVCASYYKGGSPGGGMWVYGLDWADSGYRQVADACECGNEPSRSVKCGEFLD